MNKSDIKIGLITGAILVGLANAVNITSYMIHFNPVTVLEISIAVFGFGFACGSVISNHLRKQDEKEIEGV